MFFDVFQVFLSEIQSGSCWLPPRLLFIRLSRVATFGSVECDVHLRFGCNFEGDRTASVVPIQLAQLHEFYRTTTFASTHFWKLSSKSCYLKRYVLCRRPFLTPRGCLLGAWCLHFEMLGDSFSTSEAPRRIILLQNSPGRSSPRRSYFQVSVPLFYRFRAPF